MAGRTPPHEAARTLFLRIFNGGATDRRRQHSLFYGRGVFKGLVELLPGARFLKRTAFVLDISRCSFILECMENKKKRVVYGKSERMDGQKFRTRRRHGVYINLLGFFAFKSFEYRRPARAPHFSFPLFSYGNRNCRLAP